MKKLSLLAAATLLLTQSAFASDYPQTRDERQAEEMGSILGGDGIVFHPGKTKNLSTKTADSKINQYLWQAMLDVVDFAPISSTEPDLGVISTDWYSDSKDPKRSLKLKIMIVGDVISPESIKT